MHWVGDGIQGKNWSLRLSNTLKNSQFIASMTYGLVNLISGVNANHTWSFWPNFNINERVIYFTSNLGSSPEAANFLKNVYSSFVNGSCNMSIHDKEGGQYRECYGWAGDNLQFTTLDEVKIAQQQGQPYFFLYPINNVSCNIPQQDLECIGQVFKSVLPIFPKNSSGESTSDKLMAFGITSGFIFGVCVITCAGFFMRKMLEHLLTTKLMNDYVSYFKSKEFDLDAYPELKTTLYQFLKKHLSSKEKFPILPQPILAIATDNPEMIATAKNVYFILENIYAYPELFCPVSGKLLIEPIVINDGISYDKQTMKNIHYCIVGKEGEVTEINVRITNQRLKSIALQFKEEFHKKLVKLKRDDYLCSISNDTLYEPHIYSDTHTYSKQCMDEWILQKKISPLTREELQAIDTKISTKISVLNKNIDSLLKKISQLEPEETMSPSISII